MKCIFSENNYYYFLWQCCPWIFLSIYQNDRNKGVIYVGLLILPCGIIFPFFSFFMNIFFFFFFCVQSTHISNISNIFNLTQPNLCVFVCFGLTKMKKNRIFIISKSEYVWHFLFSSCFVFLSLLIHWMRWQKEKKERCLEIVFTIHKKNPTMSSFWNFLNTAWLD